MPKKIDVKVKERCVRLVLDHLPEYPSLTAVVVDDEYRPRRWAIESAGRLGFLLAQQLVRAGEDVVDVPATLAATAPSRRMANGRLAPLLAMGRMCRQRSPRTADRPRPDPDYSQD
jgi:hypothetical protein